MKRKSPITRRAQIVLAMGLFVVSCLAALAQTTNSFFDFVQAQSKRQYTQVPHEVLAIYYVWYGQPKGSWGKADTNKHEIASTARYPVKGPYSARDPSVVDWHIEQAKAHGITGFVVSWWGKADPWGDEAFAELLKSAEKKNFKIALYWEQQRDTQGLMVQFAFDDLTYVLDRYGKSPAFLKVQGRPVVFVYDRIEWQTPLATLAEIIERTRAKAGDFVLIGHGYQSNFAYLFDGLHTDYMLEMQLHFLAKQQPEQLQGFREMAAQSFTRGTQLARQQGRIICPMIIPGFDNTKSSAAKVKAERYDGKVYRALWEEAIKTKPDWILISSWNEWPEGSEIEPSLELGDQYLKITAEYAKPFLNSPTVTVPAGIAPPRFAPTAKSEFNRLLAGRSVGILMQDIRLDAEFWSLYCGASVQRLTWNDLIDPAKFSAKKFPVVFHVAPEHFIGSVKTSGDVKKALIRYLRDGGFFVSLPFQPWPMYYDDSQGGKPAAITDDLRLGVDSWPGLPAPSALTFQVNTNALPGMQRTFPFPTTGDVRWSGTSRKRVPTYDTYVPLIQLQDFQGRYFGEGAVYVEHKTLPISPGKTIYVWMRTAEVIGEDKFYPALFEFISTKLKPLTADK
jgi:glycoprotein endo-alpha-1,2-mannosidase